MAAIRMAGLAQLVALASLPLSAHAALFGQGFGGYAAPFNSFAGPYEANETEFLNAVKTSNSTGVFKIPGYDVSKPYPGEAMDGWTISIAALDLPIPTFNAPDEYSYYKPKVAMLGYDIRIQAPDSLIKTNADTKKVDTHPSWGMCMWSWSPPNHLEKELWNNKANKPLAADGSCKGFVPDACIAALEKQAADSYAYTVHAPNATGKYTRYGSPVSCQSLKRPDECGKHGPGDSGSSIPSYGGVPIPYLNGSSTHANGWEYEEDRGEHYNSTQDLHDYWDGMVLNYWPVLTLMVNATYDPDLPSFERPDGLARLHCIAPNGMGTGKAFSFSGTVPASIDVGRSENGGDDKNENGGGKSENGGDGETNDENSSGRLRNPASWIMGSVLGFSVVLGGWLW